MAKNDSHRSCCGMLDNRSMAINNAYRSLDHHLIFWWIVIVRVRATADRTLKRVFLANLWPTTSRRLVYTQSKTTSNRLKIEQCIHCVYRVHYTPVDVDTICCFCYFLSKNNRKLSWEKKVSEQNKKISNLCFLNISNLDSSCLVLRTFLVGLNFVIY